MKKQIISLVVLIGLGLPAGATLPVVDYSHIAQDAGNEVVNFAKWAKTEIDQAQTQLNTLQTYENTVLQVARFGNPAALRSLPGISTVAELYQMYGQLSRNVATAEVLMNPQRYQADMNSILAAYQLPSWNGFTTANGLPVLPGQGMFQFSTGSYNIANNAQQELQTLDQQRQRLQQQRDAALSSLQSATTTSDFFFFGPGAVLVVVGIVIGVAYLIKEGQDKQRAEAEKHQVHRPLGQVKDAVRTVAERKDMPRPFAA
jgi:hypothetical protein